VFFRIVFQQLLLSFEKGETVSIFAPDNFSGMMGFDVHGVGISVQKVFRAKFARNWFYFFRHFFVSFFFVFL